ncbi:MAG: hypothetical protein M3423_07325 [Actinomycetota bacterium]|nr:hypothetical protein [Actinomycetota bacterium]
MTGWDPTQHDVDAELMRVLESAAVLQERVPDAVLVGGSAAAFHAGHRWSLDHDHVVSDLAERFHTVLDAVEETDGWVTNRVTVGKIILGSLGDIEAGVRQLRRSTPLDVQDVVLSSGRTLRVPTADECLRVKAFLVVTRNQTRDYLDVAALGDRLGAERAAHVLGRIDAYYDASLTKDPTPVSSQLIRQLGNPRPADKERITDLANYKGLRGVWRDWANVRQMCQRLATAMIEQPGEER